MLMALMDGRALTARELAAAAHITPATASRHLGLLVEAALLQVQQQGRHRYHRLASAEVARMLEGLMQLAAPQATRRVATGPADAALRTARSCYDHLAGRLGVAIASHLQELGAVQVDAEGASARVTPRVEAALRPLGIAADALTGQGGHRPACRPCLDWSERRPHLAGAIGAALATHCFERHWIEHIRDSRAVRITTAGRAGLRSSFGIDLSRHAAR